MPHLDPAGEEAGQTRELVQTGPLQRGMQRPGDLRCPRVHVQGVELGGAAVRRLRGARCAGEKLPGGQTVRVDTGVVW